MIWAQAHGRAIGRDGTIPWHVPEDAAHFRTLTMGAPVIMGRRTWDSLEPRFQPLPGRRNIVVTRNRAFAAEGAEAAHSVDAAIALAANPTPAWPDPPSVVWIMGGAELYAAALPFASRVELTELDLPLPDADAVAPALDTAWAVASSDPAAPAWHTSRTGIPYRFTSLVR